MIASHLSHAEWLDALLGPLLSYEVYRIRKSFLDRGFFVTEISHRVLQESLGYLFHVGRDRWQLERKMGLLAAALEIEPLGVRLKVRACWPKPPGTVLPLKVMYEANAGSDVQRIAGMIEQMNQDKFRRELVWAVDEFLPPASPKHWSPAVARERMKTDAP